MIFHRQTISNVLRFSMIASHNSEIAVRKGGDARIKSYASTSTSTSFRQWCSLVKIEGYPNVLLLITKNGIVGDMRTTNNDKGERRRQKEKSYVLYRL